MAEIECDGVWVEFPRRNGGQANAHVALQNISFNLKSGDRLGVFGPNGSGKTTLLRVLTRIYPPTRGSIASVGSIGSMLDLSAGINGKMTGRENIVFRSKLLGRSRGLIKQTLEDACDFGELSGFIDQPVETYSAGMRMRLVFSIATAVPAEILVMDEWLSVGDEKFQAKAQERVKKIVNQSEILILASHKTSLLASLGNRFLQLESGQATLLDSLEDAD